MVQCKNQYIEYMLHVIINSYIHSYSISNVHRPHRLIPFATLKRSTPVLSSLSCLCLPLFLFLQSQSQSHDSYCAGSRQPLKVQVFTVCRLRKSVELQTVRFVFQTSILSKVITGQEGETDAVGIHFAPSATSGFFGENADDLGTCAQNKHLGPSKLCGYAGVCMIQVPSAPAVKVEEELEMKRCTYRY